MRTLKAPSCPVKVTRLAPEVIPRWKRSIDLACCIIALPAFALTAFLIAALMSITSRGPILFCQERVGYQGRRFRLYKFRTMHVGAETSAHQAHFATLMNSNVPMQKLDSKRDSRLIPFGWLIRAIGIDELPQLINVLKGDMSIVGPRPCIVYEYENYSSAQRARFAATPGLTGLWQVSGKNRTTFETMIELDVQYASRRSLGLDLKIIALTLPALFGQLGDVYRARRSDRRDLPKTTSTLMPTKTLGLAKGKPTI